jgi:hypothetical protein
MVIAALVSFGILLVAWIGAPAHRERGRTVETSPEREIFSAEGAARAA